MVGLNRFFALLPIFVNLVGQVPHQYNQMLHRDVQQRQIFQSQGVSISPSGVSSSHVRQSSVSSPINGPTGGVRIQKVRVQRPTQMIQVEVSFEKI